MTSEELCVDMQITPMNFDLETNGKASQKGKSATLLLHAHGVIAKGLTGNCVVSGSQKRALIWCTDIVINSQH